MSIRRILVGVDGRERSSRALAFSAGLARRESATLTVCHVYPGVSWQSLVLSSLPTVPPVVWDAPAADDDAYAAIEREISREAADAFDAAGIRGDVLLRSGDIVAEITRLADELCADLIVIGRPRRLRSRSAVFTRRFAHGLLITP